MWLCSLWKTTTRTESVLKISPSHCFSRSFDRKSAPLAPRPNPPQTAMVGPLLLSFMYSLLSVPFKVLCSYRLPNATTRHILPPSAIPFDKCTDIMATEATLTSQGKVKLADRTAEENFNELRDLKSQFGRTKLTLSIRCDMTSDDFKKLLGNAYE